MTTRSFWAKICEILFLQIVFLLGALASVGALAGGKEMFNGSETNSQIIDKLKANQNGLYDRHVIVFAGGASHEGTIIGIGNAFFILESETGRSDISVKPPLKIYAQKLIALSSINGFEFKVSR
jgi:hypothetical protein